MKLPNFIEWPALNGLRYKMGAPMAAPFGPQSSYQLIDLPVVERLRDGGVEVEFEDIKVLRDKTLSYRGHRVLLYIRDIANYGGRQDMPRFHLTFCGTLDKMRKNKRFARYVVANRDDGEFQVNVLDQGTEARMVRLNVCQMCLAEIAWKGFRMEQPRDNRLDRVEAFALKEFFDAYPRDLNAVRPEHTSDTAPLNQYPANWNEIARGVKQARGYRCNKCALNLSGGGERYLHLHHKNGLKSDNSDRNLELLCIKCHADEPLHSHMKALPAFNEFIRYLSA